MQETAVFGGSFNPPHNGHVQIARAVLESGRADKVLFVPVFRPPHKDIAGIAPYVCRMEMLEIILDDEVGMGISDIEAELARDYPELPSYTFDTMLELEKRYPSVSFRILVGGDSLRQLHTWHRAAELLEKWKITVYPRRGELPDRHELKRFWNERQTDKLLADVMAGPLLDISSTALRNMLAGGENADKFIKPDVLCYISENKLY